MTYRQLLGDLDAWFARGVADAGPEVVLCRSGCAACCYGPFDISPADAGIVAAAVMRLEPATRSTVQLRAAHHTLQYADLEPGWQQPWDINVLGDLRFDRLSDQLAGLPCPALADNRCIIYHDRPANCRMIGLSMQTPEGGVLENACPIVHTSAGYAALSPTLFDLQAFEDRAEAEDQAVAAYGLVSTTVAGAIARTLG